MKLISSSSPYLSSRMSLQILQLPQLWNEAPIFVLVFSLARFNSFFVHCFSSSAFLFLLFDVGNGGAFFTSVVVVCSLPLFTVWACTYLPLALIGCIDPGVVYSCKSIYSHWVEPQTVDFYTGDLYLILLSDHNDNFSKYITQIVTDYCFNEHFANTG